MLNLDTSSFNKRLWFVPDTVPHIQPVRYSKDDLVFVDLRTLGASNDPDGSSVVVGIKNTDYYISFQTKRLESGKRYYDLQGAHLVTIEGKPLKGELPMPVRKLLNEVWGSQSLPKNTQEKTHG